jgi:hypothetical protein
VTGTPDPGAVTVILSGRAPDLIKTIIWLDRVTAGDDPAEVLRILHLAAIRITSERGRGQKVTLTLQLEEVTR